MAKTTLFDANLTGPITSSGDATSVASQTGTGSTFVMSASPTFTGLLSAAKGVSNGITIGDVATNSNAMLRLQGTSAGNNWLIANNNNAGGLEFTPSTAIGGTTYTTPVMTIAASGAVAMTGTLAVTGASTLGGQTTLSGGTTSAGASNNGVATGFKSGATNIILANDASATFAFGANAAGMLMVDNVSSGEDPYLLLVGGGGTFVQVVANSGYSTTLGTASRTNLQYTTPGTGTITLQNKKGAAQAYSVIFIRSV